MPNSLPPALRAERDLASQAPAVEAPRRAFLRLVGGGVVLAAAGPLAGCADNLPPEAVAAWSQAGRETDDRRWILAHALLAPHSHNLQSWLVDLRTEGEILLRCDRTRLLPATDPQSRQIVMSQGTFLEVLDLAARERGYRPEIEPFPEGPFGPEQVDDRPVARIRLVRDAAVKRDPLFAQVLQRRTNRSAYDPQRAPDAAAWQALAAALPATGLRFGFVDRSQADVLASRERWQKALRDALHTRRDDPERLRARLQELLAEPDRWYTPALQARLEGNRARTFAMIAEVSTITAARRARRRGRCGRWWCQAGTAARCARRSP